MQQYRKRQPLIEAACISIENIHQVAEWCKGEVGLKTGSSEPYGIRFKFPGHSGLAIIGEWIVKDGHFFKADSSWINHNMEPVSAPSVPTKEELTKIAVTAAVDYAAPIATEPTEVIVVYADGYLAGYKKASSGASVQPQSEGGLQWVKGSKLLKIISEKHFKIQWFAKSMAGEYESRFIGFFTRDELGGINFQTASGILISPAIEEMMFLDESASPSTANTEEERLNKEITGFDTVAERVAYDEGYSANQKVMMQWIENGISKRELFASMAMQGLLSSGRHKDDTLEQFAEAAAMAADALLAELAKPQTSTPGR